MGKLHYKDDYSTIDLDHIVPCIIHTSKGMAHHSEHYKQVHEKLLEVLNEQQTSYNRLHILVDNREAGPISSTDIDYYRTSVIPLLRSCGVQHVAFVLPQKMMSNIILRELFKNIEDQNLTVKEFENRKEARRWLKAVSSSVNFYG